MNALAEILRRLDNLIRLGTIAEVDLVNARCRVKTGEITTSWLPWHTPRAGMQRRWSPPTRDEQCLLLSPSGELSQGVAITGLFSAAHTANGDRAGLERITYADGAVLEYDDVAHLLKAALPEAGRVELIAPAGITITGDVTINGLVTVSEDVVADGISLVGHKHGGVQVGGGQTGAPL